MPIITNKECRSPTLALLREGGIKKFSDLPLIESISLRLKIANEFGNSAQAKVLAREKIGRRMSGACGKDSEEKEQAYEESITIAREYGLDDLAHDLGVEYVRLELNHWFRPSECLAEYGVTPAEIRNELIAGFLLNPLISSGNGYSSDEDKLRCKDIEELLAGLGVTREAMIPEARRLLNSNKIGYTPKAKIALYVGLEKEKNKYAKKAAREMVRRARYGEEIELKKCGVTDDTVLQYIRR